MLLNSSSNEKNNTSQIAKQLLDLKNGQVSAFSRAPIKKHLWKTLIEHLINQFNTQV